MTSLPHIEVYQSRKTGLWHSRWKGKNGEILWSGEASDAKRGSKSCANAKRLPLRIGKALGVKVVLRDGKDIEVLWEPRPSRKPYRFNRHWG